MNGCCKCIRVKVDGHCGDVFRVLFLYTLLSNEVRQWECNRRFVRPYFKKDRKSIDSADVCRRKMFFLSFIAVAQATSAYTGIESLTETLAQRFPGVDTTPIVRALQLEVLLFSLQYSLLCDIKH